MLQSIDILQMPGQSDLFKEYLINSKWREQHFGYSLLNLEEDFKSRCRDLTSQTFDRSHLSQTIEAYMKSFGLSPQTKINLEKLKKANSVCIITGQQPALFGGPLYNFYKAFSAINLATQMEAKTGIPMVPVFWNASNDHDVAEGNRFYFPDKQRRLAKCSLKSLASLPLDRVLIANEIGALKSKIENEISRIDFLDEVWPKLLPLPEDTIGSWQTRILNNLCQEKGLLILEPKILKKLSDNALAKLLINEDRLISQINTNSLFLKNKNFHAQVESDVSSRMMLYQKNAGRNRLQKDSDLWVNGNKKWKLNELIENNNDDFEITPDALGRPIWQDMLLPVAAYIAGPGEIAYYHQLKGCYEIFGMKMPLILPRLNGTILEKNHGKLLKKLKIPLDHFYELKQLGHMPIVVPKMAKEVPAALIELWKSEAKTADEMKIFETFRSKTEKLNRKFYEKLERVRMNVEGIGNKQLEEWKDFVFPGNQYQERIYGVLPFLARHGPQFLQFLENETYEVGKHFIYTTND